MPRTLLLAEARQAEVNALLRGVLERRGALLDEQTHARTVFEGLGGGGAFRRGGYLGAYQPVGEKQVEVVVQAWATAARRLFWGTVAAELVLVLLLLGASPPSSVFYIAAIALWVWLGLAALLYYLTFRGTRALEDELTASLAAALRAAGLRVLGDEEQLEQRIRERLEGEVQQRQLEAKRAAEPRPARKGLGLAAKPKAERPAKAARPAKPAKAKPPRPPKERKPGLFGRKQA